VDGQVDGFEKDRILSVVVLDVLMKSEPLASTFQNKQKGIRMRTDLWRFLRVLDDRIQAILKDGFDFLVFCSFRIRVVNRFLDNPLKRSKHTWCWVILQ
jgi:hypothetical protein